MKTEEALSEVVLKLGWTELSVGLILLLAFQSLVAMWLKGRLEGSIKHEYDKRLKDYEAELRIRDQAARVASLLAMKFSNKVEPSAFNALAWELSLWLPAELVRELTRCLVGVESAMNPKELLIKVRKILLQNPKDDLLPENLVHMEDPRGRAELAEAIAHRRLS